jgi:hypothetical protein
MFNNYAKISLQNSRQNLTFASDLANRVGFIELGVKLISPLYRMKPILAQQGEEGSYAWEHKNEIFNNLTIK